MVSRISLLIQVTNIILMTQRENKYIVRGLGKEGSCIRLIYVEKTLRRREREDAAG